METSKAPSLKLTSPIQFIRESIGELKKVNWPTRNETIKLTVVVVTISLIVGGFIGGIDLLFLRISSFIFQR
jgi:preprotein translocase subunit SecE